MSDAQAQRLLEALLDSWDSNNTILLNLLRAVPKGGFEARAMEGIHRERMVSVSEEAPRVRGKRGPA
jgi:hypothetical protein